MTIIVNRRNTLNKLATHVVGDAVEDHPAHVIDVALVGMRGLELREHLQRVPRKQALVVRQSEVETLRNLRLGGICMNGAELSQGRGIVAPIIERDGRT